MNGLTVVYHLARGKERFLGNTLIAFLADLASEVLLHQMQYSVNQGTGKKSKPKWRLGATHPHIKSQLLTWKKAGSSFHPRLGSSCEEAHIAYAQAGVARISNGSVRRTDHSRASDASW